MAISETSNAPSRTIGLKPLLVGEYCANSNSTRSDLTRPFFSAAVPGWSPSRVLRRIATSALLACAVNSDNDRLHASSSNAIGNSR